MTDDAELRARIEAQVAARRARGSPPKGRRPPAEPETGPPPTDSAHDGADGNPAADEPAVTPRRPLLSRRRKRGDEPYEKFTLPEPDAAFAQPWLRPAHPSPSQQRTPPATARPTPVDLSKPERRGRPAPGVGTIAAGTPASRPPAERPRPPLGISGANDWGTASGPDRPQAPDDEGPSGLRVTQRARRVLVRTLVIVLIATIATVLLWAFVVQPYAVASGSMEPTLHGCPGCNEDHVLVDKLSYRAHDIRAGDIVVFHRPATAPKLTAGVLIDRVVGRPGDVVELRTGRVYVNGLVLDEPYVSKACGPDATAAIPRNGKASWTVPANDVFVLGDNRCHSVDSRVFGPIASSSVIGRAFAIIWPIGRLRLL